MYLGKIDYSQPKLGFEGLPELERYADYAIQIVCCYCFVTAVNL